MKRRMTAMVVASVVAASVSVVGGRGAAAAVNNQLLGVSCITSDSCVAVGDQERGSLVEMWDGKAWSIDAAAEAPGGLLTAVSCVSSGVCVAVGYTGVYQHPLVEVWNGSAWSIEHLKSTDGTYFLGVSCPGSTDCIAVGARPGGGTRGRTLAEEWNGSTWTVQTTPNPKGSGQPYAQLEAVSCTGPKACEAIGQWQGFTSGAVGATLAEVWNGTAWKLQPIPNPEGYGGGILTGDSCPAADACVAVGTHDNSIDDPVPLAERWNGSVWRIQHTPSSGIASYDEVNGVSCTSARSCIAVGYYYGEYRAVALRWNGRAWTLQHPPNPSYRNILAGVSCTSADHCVAVGTRYDESEAGNTLVEIWNGSSWTVQPSANP